MINTLISRDCLFLLLLFSVVPRLLAQQFLVNGDRLNAHIQQLHAIAVKTSPDSSRLAFSETDLAGRKYVIHLMREAGLETQIDFAGNIIGRREGSETGLAPIMLGSHIDSVPGGGRYDGPVGVMAAIEVAQIFFEKEHNLKHPLEIIVFINEEGGKTGSRMLIGEVMQKEFDLVTASGKTIRKGIEYVGGDPVRLSEVLRKPGSVAAFLEMHIEQGAILHSENIAIGVVEGIVGIKRWNVTVAGFANHAGTTPMNKRKDALLAAAKFIEAANNIAVKTPGRQVATVGRVRAFPGAPNVIPGKVELSLEIRDLRMSKIDSLFDLMAGEAQVIEQTSGITFGFDHFYTSKAAPTDPAVSQLIAESATNLKLNYLTMPSGAGHDAQSIAILAPIGMIFIPSVEGISHSPKEFSHPADITNGANVLLQTVLRLDQALSK